MNDLKKDILHYLAYGYSVLCYPLFTPTIIAAIYTWLYTSKQNELEYLPSYLPLYWAILIGGTFLFTCLIPIIVLLIMKHNGDITDLDVSEQSQRTLPYLYTLFSMSFWCALLLVMQVPRFLFYSSIASIIALIIVSLITPKWKISAHLTSFGGCTAMLIGILWYLAFPTTWITYLLLLMAWLLMLARIQLNAHTPLQVICGYLLGLTLVMVPNIILLS